jgi:hypothetical protein
MWTLNSVLAGSRCCCVQKDIGGNIVYPQKKIWRMAGDAVTTKRYGGKMNPLEPNHHTTHTHQEVVVVTHTHTHTTYRAISPTQLLQSIQGAPKLTAS